MIKQHRTLLGGSFVALSIFLLAGCQYTPPAASNNSTPVEQQEEAVTTSTAVYTEMRKAYAETYGYPEKMPKVIDPSISVKDQKHEEIFAQNKYLVKAVYPVITQLPDSAIVKDLNQQIEKGVNDVIAFYQPMAKDWGKDQPSGKNSEISVTYRPFIITSKFISLQFHASLDSFGLYKTWNSRIPFVYDAEKGVEVKLEDFFKKDSSYLEKLSKLSLSQTIEVYNQNDSSMLSKGEQDMMTPKKENFQDFVVTKDGLLFFFDFHAAGPAIIAIPWSELKDVLDENGPIRLIQQS